MFYTYYNQRSQRLKNRDRKDAQDKARLDILLVVNMFLTGFDAKKVNIHYVDKNLRHHGLIQAFSRTNRILGQLKSQGKVVCFRNLKPNTDEAITLFSNKKAIETILLAPYEDYLNQFNAVVAILRDIAATPSSVDDLISEVDQLASERAFRDLIRLRNVLTSFTEFDLKALDLDAQTFEDYRSKYLDIYDKTKTDKPTDAVSIIGEIDFELELIQRDEIDIAHILALLASATEEADSLDPKIRNASTAKRKLVADFLGSERHLHSKRDLIEKFIEQHMPALSSGQDVQAAYSDFWNVERLSAIEDICAAERIDPLAFRAMIEQYHFSGKRPPQGEIVEALAVKPKILERKSVVERIVGKLLSLVSTFDDGMAAVCKPQPSPECLL